MTQTALNGLILTDEALDKLSEAVQNQITYDWCFDTLRKIAEQTPDSQEQTPLDKILWTLRCAYLIGHRNAMELIRDTIQLHTQTTG